VASDSSVTCCATFKSGAAVSAFTGASVVVGTDGSGAGGVDVGVGVGAGVGEAIFTEGTFTGAGAGFGALGRIDSSLQLNGAFCMHGTQVDSITLGGEPLERGHS
jgi:hypothetical protein